MASKKSKSRSTDERVRRAQAMIARRRKPGKTLASDGLIRDRRAAGKRGD